MAALSRLSLQYDPNPDTKARWLIGNIIEDALVGHSVSVLVQELPSENSGHPGKKAVIVSCDWPLTADGTPEGATRRKQVLQALVTAELRQSIGLEDTCIAFTKLQRHQDGPLGFELTFVIDTHFPAVVSWDGSSSPPKFYVENGYWKAMATLSQEGQAAYPGALKHLASAALDAEGLSFLSGAFENAGDCEISKLSTFIPRHTISQSKRS